MHNHRRKTSAKPRAKISQGPYHLRLKCFTQVRFPCDLSCHCSASPFTIDYGFLGSQNFDSDISHWANSSSQVPACSIEPGTPSDVGKIVNASSCCYITSHILAHTFHTNHYSLSRLTSLVCRSQ